MTTKAPTRVRCHLPPLHPGQQEVADSEARFRVICCGRQWGKTSLAAAIAIKAAAEGQRIWWVAPSFRLTAHGWEALLLFARQVSGYKIARRPIAKVAFSSGGSVTLASSDNPDSLRGGTLDGVVGDEWATAKPEAWTVLQPSLALRKGWGLFISTPKGLNHFHELYEEAAVHDGWERWQFPSRGNPRLSDKEVERARLHMSSLMFAQEYEAEFTSAATSLFRADWIQHYRTRFEGDEKFYLLGEEAVAESSCRSIITADLAWTVGERADYTVISTWAITPLNHLILADCIRGRFEGPDVVQQLRQAYEKSRYAEVVIEKASRGLSIIQEAERAGLPIREVIPDKDKVQRSYVAQARMERGTVWWPPRSTPWWPELEQELTGFPVSKHDDFCDTLFYAAIEVAQGASGPGIQVIELSV